MKLDKMIKKSSMKTNIHYNVDKSVCFKPPHLKMSSYQKLKYKNFELQEQVDMFKKALTYCHTEPKIIGEEECFTEYSWMIHEQKFIEEQLKYRLTLWVANNLDKKTIMELLKLREKNN